MRDHEPITTTDFGGLWARGDPESCPLDHFTDCNNIKFIQSGFATRDGLNIFPPAGTPGSVQQVVRHYTYVHKDTESLIVLDNLGNIYHVIPGVSTTLILSIPAMTDFDMVNIAGRAYISPSNGVTGLPNVPLYVYLGDGNPARKAAGAGPSTALTTTLVFPGHVEPGIHLFNVVYETNTGFLTSFDAQLSTDNIIGTGAHAVSITNVPISPDAFVVARHIIASKSINPSTYTGNKTGYIYYFIPNGKINDNLGTTITVDFYDADLLEDASHLLDNFAEIPSFVAVNTYHDRFVGVAEWGDPNNDEEFKRTSIARISAKGEPEAISKLDGLIVAPLDGTPLTNAQEYRDVLYLYKNTRTFSYNDNDDAPSSWPGITIDQGAGCSVHGIAEVLDSGGINVEFCIITNYSGVMIFNGSFARPELSWKIEDLWGALKSQDDKVTRQAFSHVQIMNDSLTKRLYITLPTFKILYADYGDGLDPKNIKWCPWEFPFSVTTVAMMNINQLIIGAKNVP